MEQKALLYYIVLSLLTAVTSINCSGYKESADKIPFTLFDDFETGELFGWEQYPYAEDIGFDALFSTHQTPTYNDSRYALARPVRANDIVEIYQGFTKRIDLWTIPETRLKTALYFQSDRNPESVEISLGTFDGRLYKHVIKNPEANQWLELDIPLVDFQSDDGQLTSKEHIQVVTIEGTYQMVYYLYTYTILMDNFQLNGERQRQFIGVVPSSTNFDKFNVSVLNKHFYYGDTIALVVQPEAKIPLKQVLGKLIDGSGNLIKDSISFNNENGDWQNNSIHQVAENDLPGQWEILLTGKSKVGPDVKWGLKFLVPGKPVVDHPRLFFTEASLKDRLENENSPIARRILDNALENTDFMDVDIDAIEEGIDRTAENLVGGPYSKTTVGFKAYGAWNNPNRALGKVIEEGSFRYAFTGDIEAAKKAKKALLKLCSFKKWNAAWMMERKFWTYYPVGYTLLPVAYGYDILYDLLSEEERKMIREAIMEKGIKLFYRDMVEMNRMSSNLTNHIAVLVGGHGLAATAIYGDDPENPYLEPYLSGIITKAKTFIDNTYYKDGSYGEPKSGYMNMATKEIVLIMEAFERNFGLNWAETTDVENFYKYPLQATHPNGTMPDFGDGGGHFHSFTQHHSEYFVYRTGNPFLYKYVKPHWESGEGDFWGYLWYRDDIIPETREILPSSKAFEAQGMVMRSNWEDSASVISTRIGPHSNHYHFDQGSFQIFTNGEPLLTDPSYGAGGYYTNLDYNVYNIHAIAHNVMLIDHDAESQKPADYDNGIAAHRNWPQMTHVFTSEISDAVEADLTSVYKNKLSTYNRILLYTKTGPLFLFDQVKSKSKKGHVYDWLFHAPVHSITYEDHRMTIDRPEARMTLDIISPEIKSHSIRHNEPDHESFITLSSESKLTNTNFLAVIVPEAKPKGKSFGPLPKTNKIEAPGWIGARVESGGSTDFGLFRIDPSASEVAGFNTDAKRFTASFNRKGSLHKVYFEGTEFSGHALSIKTDQLVTLAILIHSKDLAITVDSKNNTNLSLTLDQKPTKVYINGILNNSWKYLNEKSLNLSISEGKTDLLIEK